MTPGAVVDLRNGGEWTAHFPGGKTGGGTILSFVPEQEMTLSAMAPEQFPTVRAERTTARFQFIAKDDSTVVRLVQTGWKTGEEWDKAYDYLAQGNAQLLETLRRRFVNGPIDWAKEWGLPAAGEAEPMTMANLNIWAILGRRGIGLSGRWAVVFAADVRRALEDGQTIFRAG